jgi:murein DD-endopeptidase MepM/ murein hydrolase activator NlpD
MATDPTLFAAAVLKGVGAPVTPGNIAGFIGWSQAEGPLASSNWQRNNPLNTTEGQGAVGGAFNSSGVRTYPDTQTGIAATIKTLLNGNYGGILSAFKSNNPSGLGGAIGSSPWGTSGQLASQTIAAALKQGYKVPSGTLGATPAATPAKVPTVSANFTPIQSSAPNIFNTLAGLEQTRQNILANAGVKQSPATSAVEAGWTALGNLFTSRQSEMTAQQQAANRLNPASSPATVGPQAKASSKGIVNPFPHGFKPNRLDAGFDGTFTHQIVAPITGTITYASPSFSNWGGYLVLKSANGEISNLGTDSLYFAEGLTPLVKIGTRVTAGQPIAQAASSPWNGITGNIEWGLAQPGVMGQPTDPYAYVAPNKPGSVIALANWAKGLGVPGPTQTSHAGYA